MAAHWSAHDRMRRQVDDWCRTNLGLPTLGVIRCGDCGAGMAIRWRSAGDSLKLGCMECGLETDVARAKDWKARPDSRSPGSHEVGSG